MALREAEDIRSRHSSRLLSLFSARVIKESSTAELPSASAARVRLNQVVLNREEADSNSGLDVQRGFHNSKSV